jgi:hypothetical protein
MQPNAAENLFQFARVKHGNAIAFKIPPDKPTVTKENISYPLNNQKKLNENNTIVSA